MLSLLAVGEDKSDLKCAGWLEPKPNKVSRQNKQLNPIKLKPFLVLHLSWSAEKNIGTVTGIDRCLSLTYLAFQPMPIKHVGDSLFYAPVTSVLY
jgi:hypothetical protein